MRLLKYIGLNLIIAYIGIGAVINITRQYNILKGARIKNAEVKEKIAKLEEENQNLKQKISYATSSAFLDQEVRDKLGLGRPDDVWIKIGETGGFTQ